MNLENEEKIHFMQELRNEIFNFKLKLEKYSLNYIEDEFMYNKYLEIIVLLEVKVNRLTNEIIQLKGE